MPVEQKNSFFSFDTPFWFFKDMAKILFWNLFWLVLHLTGLIPSKSMDKRASLSAHYKNGIIGFKDCQGKNAKYCEEVSTWYTLYELQLRIVPG